MNAASGASTSSPRGATTSKESSPCSDARALARLRIRPQFPGRVRRARTALALERDAEPGAAFTTHEDAAASPGRLERRNILARGESLEDQRTTQSHHIVEERTAGTLGAGEKTGRLIERVNADERQTLDAGNRRANERSDRLESAAGHSDRHGQLPLLMQRLGSAEEPLVPEQSVPSLGGEGIPLVTQRLKLRD